MRVALLGSASALSTAERDNTSLVVEIEGALFLIDCAGSPAKKLLQLGLDYTRLDNIFVTHRHPDHVYGLPSLMHEMLLVGRKRKLTLFLPRSSQRVVQPFVETLFVGVAGMYEIEYRALDMIEEMLLLEGENYQVFSTPVIHSDDTLAYKFVELKHVGSDSESVSFVYSSDTKPSENLIRLAQRANLLIHECTYLDGEPAALNTTHSNARQVGELAARARVKKLGLVHFGIEAEKNLGVVLNQVKGNYSGEIVLGKDGMVFYI